MDPSDNNNIVGVIRTPQPHSHLTAPSLFSPPSQPYKVCCPGKIKLFYHSPLTLSHSLYCQQPRRGRRWSAGNASVTSSSQVYEEIQVISNKLTPAEVHISHLVTQGGDNFAITWYFDCQAAADAQKIGKLFSVVENYKILNNYSQPFKQSTTDEIVGFVAALTKVGFIKRNDISYTTSFCSDDSRTAGDSAGDQTQQNL